MDTIFALATVRGRAGIAVMRISGQKAFEAGIELTGSLPEPGRAALRKVRDETGSVIDEALVICFAAPRSFTGEDVVELQLHGSPAVIAATEKAIADAGLARYAEAGEFTRRALNNEKMDIAQVEGLGDLLSAETEAQRKQALRLLDGELGRLAGRWRVNLLRSAALLEATIDFADEDVPVDVFPEVHELLGEVIADLEKEIAGSRYAERIREGFEVAILGSPNAGKSTLLNHIAGRDVAIISDVPGTTRDILEVRMDLGGVPVTVLDTAGLRESEDTVEKIGISRTRKRAEDADLRIFLLAAGEEAPQDMRGPEDIVVQGKCDVTRRGGVSGKTGEGVEALLRDVQEILSNRAAAISTATHARHRLAMEQAKNALEEARRVMSAAPDTPELAAEDTRKAMASLDSLTGHIDVEAVLGEIFSSFCIGK